MTYLPDEKNSKFELSKGFRDSFNKTTPFKQYYKDLMTKSNLNLKDLNPK